MINPGTYNIICPQGATYDRTFTITQNGSPLNLTGYTAALQVRSSADASATLVSLTSSSGITLGGTAGTIALVISSVVTAALPTGSLTYDLEIYSGSQTTRLLQGAFNVSPGVTR